MSVASHRAAGRVGVSKTPSQRGWRRLLYVLLRINLGLSPAERHGIDIRARIRRPAPDSDQIGVVGLKGGVGRTAATVALGSALSRIRGDRILAIDADPCGDLADRARRQSAATLADMLADPDIARYQDIRAYISINDDKLEVLASADDSATRGSPTIRTGAT